MGGDKKQKILNERYEDDDDDESSDDETYVEEEEKPVMEPVVTTTKPVKMSLKEAEAKLFDVNLGFDVQLRIPFQEPPNTKAEHVYVSATVSLERGNQDKNRVKFADAASKQAVICLRKHFAAVDLESSKLHLRLHVTDCYPGDREARIFSPGSGVGAVRFCLVWILCLPNGSVVLDGGRLGMTDDHWMGVLDMLHLKSGERTIMNGLIPKVCETIQQRIDIPSDRTWYNTLL